MAPVSSVKKLHSVGAIAPQSSKVGHSVAAQMAIFISYVMADNMQVVETFKALASAIGRMTTGYFNISSGFPMAMTQSFLPMQSRIFLAI
ncbi:MAG: hypothetical protein H7317_19035 [Pseudorhodobacter sp.]|nr:hypothetical protein [Pseudorhodobacter sp.]